MKQLKIGVAIIESLGNEKKTGKELFETTLKYIAFEKPYVEHEYFEVKNSSGLLTVLDELYKKSTLENKFYFLHFEVHGKEGGIELQNGEIVSWQVVLPYLRKLNILYRNKLAVYMAVCKGNSLLKYVNHMERAPFGLLMGSFSNVYQGDIMEIFEVFYQEFFKVLSPLNAYKKIKQLDLRSDFTVLTSQHIIDIFLNLESEYNDRELILGVTDAHFKESEDKSEEFNEIMHKFRCDIKKIFDEYKVDVDFFLMKDMN